MRRAKGAEVYKVEPLTGLNRRRLRDFIRYAGLSDLREHLGDAEYHHVYEENWLFGENYGLIEVGDMVIAIYPGDP